MKSFASPMICVLAVACMAPANPPSLLPRAIENEAEAPNAPEPVAAPKAIDSSIAAKLASLIAEARAGDADFTKAEQANAGALAAGRKATPGSEAWIAAELVRSALQVARQRSTIALAQIDSLAISQGERAAGDSSVGGLDDIRAAQAGIEVIVARQTARLDALNR